MTAKSWFTQNTELSLNSLYQYVHDSEVLIHPEHRTVGKLTISVRTWQRSLDSPRTPNCRWTHYISTYMTAKSWFTQNTELSINSLYQYVHDREVLIHSEHRTVGKLTISVRTWQRSPDSLRTPNCRWTHYISTYMTAKSWFTQNTELSLNSLGFLASGQQSRTWRFSLAKETSDWRKENNSDG